MMRYKVLLLYLGVLIVLGIIAGILGPLLYGYINVIELDVANYPGRIRVTGAIFVGLGPGDYRVVVELKGYGSVVEIWCDGVPEKIVSFPGSLSLKVSGCEESVGIVYSTTIEGGEDTIGWVRVVKEWP